MVVINTAQTLLKRQYPDVGGLQNIHIGRDLNVAIDCNIKIPTSLYFR